MHPSTAGVALVPAFQGCGTPTDDPDAARRSRIKELDGKILTSIYQAQPESVHLVASSAGYATVSTVGLNGKTTGAGAGEGIATDRATREQTYLEVRTLDTATGPGVAELQVLLIFKKQATYQAFLDKGWTLGGGAQASDEAYEAGEANEEPGDAIAPVTDPIVYEITGADVAKDESVDGLRIEVDYTLE